MKPLMLVCLLLAAALGLNVTYAADLQAASAQKLDSDLGNLPPYSEWHRHAHLKHMVIAAPEMDPNGKIDNGLGELPPFSVWNQHPSLEHIYKMADSVAQANRATPANIGLR
jgi:hypothetical protein